jgi:Ca2+-binding RTX toxin-like protein
MTSSESGTSNRASDIINESQLESATVASALDLSEVSYDTYGTNGVMYTKNAGGVLVVDQKVYDLTDPSNGWTQITGLTTEDNTADHYQGVAFYKVTNGITEIVIANRGSQPGGGVFGYQDYVESDGGLSVGLTPQADQDALAYYNAVVAWAQTQNFASRVNILEAGHSLGGQEADYVEVSVSSNPATEYNTQAVTFNAPGLGHFVAQSGVNYDALNIVLDNDFVHVGGAAINGGYAGVQTTLSGGVPIQPYENDIMLGLLGNPAKLITGLRGFVINGLYVNHITDPLDAYLQEHPALGGVDLLQYYPTQITLAAIDVMESETSPTDYLQMSPSELAQYYTNLLGAPAGPGSGSGSAPPAGAQNPISNSGGETFTESTTDNFVVLTGSDGDVYTLTTGAGTLTVTDSAGDTDTITQNSVGAVTSDSWSNATGVTGQDTYNSDGPSSGKLTYADGGYATYFDDGQGDITTDYYTTSGVLFSWSASHSDGSAITGTEFGNGVTTLPGSTAADLSIPTSLYQTTLNPDGSYAIASWNPANQSMLTEYDSSGNVTSSSTAQGPGQNYSQSDLTETTSTDSSGRTTTVAHEAAGDLVWQSWANTDGSSGKITYNASDVVIEKDVNADGSSELTYSYVGNVTHNFFDKNGLIVGDTWTMADGTTGEDTFNADGSAHGTIEKTDGSESLVTIDTALDILIDNESASGDMLSQDWWQNNGTHGVTTYNSGGSYTIYTYQTDGQVQVTDYSASGAVEGQDTMPAGAAFSPDGSEFGEVTNPDGSYSVDYTDSDGESQIFNVASGTIQSIDHLSSQQASEFSIPTQSGPDAQSPYNPSTPVTVSADGTQTIGYLNGSDSVTGDSWAKPDGTHGVDTFEADGSRFGTVFATDGSYYTYTNSGAGDATTEYYDANGDLTSDAWQYADGSYGSDQYNADGSSSGYAYAADGSYTNYVNDGQGDITDDSFSTTGALVGDSWEKPDGSYGSDTINADGSKTGVGYQANGNYLTYAADSSGDDLTKYYLASNQLEEQVWELQDADGASVTFTFDGSGNLLSQAVNASSGTSYSLTGGVNGALGSLVDDMSNGATLTGAASGGVIVAWGNQDSITSGGGSTVIDAGGADDVVTGGSGNDTLDALGAGTTLLGGLGNETFEINDATDVVQARSVAVSNILYSTVSYTLPTNVDTLTLQGTGDLIAYGNRDASNLITANSGNDTLVAGSGEDTLVSGSGVDEFIGGARADAFYVNNTNDWYHLPDYNGYEDTIFSSVSYSLGGSNSVRNLTLTGTADLTAADYFGYSTLTGNAGNDTLYGGFGDDVLVSGTGVDTLVTGTGNNTLIVNNAADVVEVSPGAGSDIIEASVSYTLQNTPDQSLSALELIGSGNLVGEGNSDSSNYISGNAGDDTLIAGSGSDTLIGGTGVDTLVAGSGTDLLEGNAGDTFDIGSGNAAVEVSQGSGTLQFGVGVFASQLSLSLVTGSNGDPALLITDGASSVTVDGGLQGSISDFDFDDGSQLTLAQLLAAGQVVNSTLVGANGDIILDGAQADSLTTSDGDDTIYAAGSNDTIIAGNGNQALYGLGTDEVLAASTGNDSLYGGAGADTLIAGIGYTQMQGGTGDDTFVLTEGGTSTLTPGSTAGDELIYLPQGMTIADFTAYQDGDNLIVQSLSGDTTAVINGFYGMASADKTWLIADGSGVQFLANWVGSQHQAPGPNGTYEQTITAARLAYMANLGATLSKIGQAGGTIAEPDQTTPTQDYTYTFTGVGVQNLSVSDNGTLNIGSSENDQKSYTYSQSEQFESWTTPVYSTVTLGGYSYFLPVNNTVSYVGDDDQGPQPSIVFFGNMTITTQYDAAGNVIGDKVTVAPVTFTEQTGVVTHQIIIPVETTHTTETQGFGIYNITADDTNDVIIAQPNFVGSVALGNGNDYVDLGGADFNGTYGVAGTNLDGHLIVSGLIPGAFIQAGNGNDFIGGTGGEDAIAAGTGFDTLQGWQGTAYYVPMSGDSTDIIDANSAYYAYGPYEQNTLVLPEGVTAQNLQVKAFSDSFLIGQYVPPDSIYDDFVPVTLQLTYGDSTVIVPVNAGTFGGGDNIEPTGIQQFQFADGSVLTLAQMLAMAGPVLSTSDYSPVVEAQDVTVTGGQSVISAANLFTASDSSGSNVTWYQVTESDGSAGYFTLNGVAQNSTFLVSQEQLSGLDFAVHAAGSADTVSVKAWDGIEWGIATSFNILVPGAAGQLMFAATGPDQEVVGSTSGPDTLIGGYSGDTLVGASGQDTFVYDMGSGAEEISETVPNSSTSANVLQFGAGISPGSISLSLTGNSQLLLTLDSSGDSILIDGFNATDPFGSMPIQQFQYANGTTLTLAQLLIQVQPSSEFDGVSNGNGTTTYFEVNAVGDPPYAAWTINASGQTLQAFTLYADGSTEADSYVYDPDGSYAWTAVATPAGGGGATTYVTDYNAQGQDTSSLTTNPDGSAAQVTYNSQGSTVTYDLTAADGSTDNTTYTYNADGSGGSTEIVTPANGSGATTTVTDWDTAGDTTIVDVTNPDGSTVDSTYSYNPDGSYQETVLATLADGGPSTTTVYDYDASGNLIAGNQVQASGADQTVTGSASGPDTLTGGYAGDTLIGASGRDTFDYAAGSGAETISETAPVSSISANTLQLGAGITASAISGSINADGSVTLSTGSGGDSITLEGFNPLNPLGSMPIQQFEFADGSSLTFAQLLSQMQSSSTEQDVTTANGTTTAYAFNADGGQGGPIYYGKLLDAQGQLLQQYILNSDDSSETDRYLRNADGSHSDTEVQTTAAGAVTTLVSGFDAQGNEISYLETDPDGSSGDLSWNTQGQKLSEVDTSPDGSSSNTTYSYNADGSYTSTEVETPAGGGATTTSVIDADNQGNIISDLETNPDGSSSYLSLNTQGQKLSEVDTSPDGSSLNTTYSYNADGSYTSTEVETPTGGGATTTSVIDVDNQGNIISDLETNPDGSSSDLSWNTQGQKLSEVDTWPDGSSSNTTFAYNVDGSLTTTEVETPAGGAPATTQVASYDSSGNQLNDNSFTPGTNGSYTDEWYKPDGSNGSYWWNSSTDEYRAALDDANGTSWTDDYQYASGGSPGSTGVSFTETYGDSGGDQGTRQYDAATAVTTVSWYSAATGTITGTVTDSGFIGLQNDGELMNAQPALAFFNPATSPAFQNFLTAH